MDNEINPQEVNAIVGKILALTAEHISSSDEVLIAALKIAATTMDEAKNAQFAVQMRAGMLSQSRPKR